MHEMAQAPARRRSGEGDHRAMAQHYLGTARTLTGRPIASSVTARTVTVMGFPLAPLIVTLEVLVLSHFCRPTRYW